MKKKLVFKGAATALVTPFINGNIDYNALDAIVEHQIAGGISALVIGGTTGEAATLSPTERFELYGYAKAKVAGRAKLIFGTGTNDTRVAIEHTKMAEELRADGVLIVTPYYNKGTHKGVLEHYKRIASETDLPIILYNVPARTGVNLTIKQLAELSKIKNIVGIKEAADSIDRLTEISGFGDELYLYAGNDTQIYPTLALGGMGVISVISNLYPAFVKNICHNYFQGNTEESRCGQLKIFNLSRTMFTETNPTPIKYAMSLHGLCRAELRLPLAEAEERTKDEIKKEISDFEGAI